MNEVLYLHLFLKLNQVLDICFNISHFQNAEIVKKYITFRAYNLVFNISACILIKLDKLLFCKAFFTLTHRSQK